MITEIELDEDIYHDTRDIGASSVRVYGDINDINRVADYARQLNGKQIASKENTEEAKDVDMVNHPPHYEHGIECIDEMILLYGKEETMSFCKLNAHKYRKRALYKCGEQDQNKSDWYVRMYACLKENSEATLRMTILKKYDMM